MTEKRTATLQAGGHNVTWFSSVSRHEAFYLLLIILAGAAFRIYHIGWLPLWLDEAASEWMSRQSVSYLLTVLPTYETNPPFYYLLLKGWRTLLGDGESALRSLSALIGTATIPVVFIMGRMLGGKLSGGTVGLLAAAMFALSPLHVLYGQEARAYTLLVFSVALSMLGMMWLIFHTPQICARSDQPEFEKGGKHFPWVLGLLALGMAMIMWSHDTGALAVLAIVLPGVYWWVTDAKCSLRALIRLAIAGVFALALFLPYLGHLLSHMGMVKSFWIVAPTWSDITEVTTRIFGSATQGAFIFFIVFWSLGIFGINALWRRGLRSVVFLLLSVGLVPMGLELLVSFFAMPIFLDRTLIYASIPLFIAAAYAITQIPVRSGVAAVSLVGILMIDLGLYYKEAKKEPWNLIAAYLSDSLQPGEPVILLPNYLLLPLDYYASRQKRDALQRIGVPVDWQDPALRQQSRIDQPAEKKTVGVDLDRISRLIRGSKKLGMVMRRVDLVDPKLLVKQEVLKTHVITETKVFYTVTVLLFEARESHGDVSKP